MMDGLRNRIVENIKINRRRINFQKRKEKLPKKKRRYLIKITLI